MSWFTDYIGKAENLLNALDSSAGDLLSNSLVESSTIDASGYSTASYEASTPNVSSLSSSYLSQQSPPPSFTAKRSSVPPTDPPSSRSKSSLASSCDSRGNDAASDNMSRSTPAFVSSKSTFSLSGRDEQTSSSPTPYSLDSSRLSQQLLRGSIGATESPSVSTASSTVDLASTRRQSNDPVISVTSSASAPNNLRNAPDEDSLLKFLNAPTSDSQWGKRRDGTPVSSTPRATPSKLSAPPASEEVARISQEQRDSTVITDHREGNHSQEAGKSEENSTFQSSRSALLAGEQSVERPVFSDTEEVTLVAETSPELSDAAMPASVINPLSTPFLDELHVEEKVADKAEIVVSDETHPVEFTEVSLVDVPRGKLSSSNGSSVSGASIDGDDADLSDAMKESPTSPESEPELLLPSRYFPSDHRREDAANAAVVGALDTKSPEMSEGVHLSSGHQTESEPEMIPSPPVGGEDARGMTLSQVSSSISQRFSDCEILSAGELAEGEDARELGSPPRQQSTEDVPPIATSTIAAPSTSESLSLSKLQLENQLLRSEIQSLNEEMQGAWRQTQMAKEERVRVLEELATAENRVKDCEERLRDAAEDFTRERKRCTAEAKDQLLDMERRLKEALSLNNDARMSLEAKDGQLAVLRVRLDEADATTEQLRRKCAEMEDENRRNHAARETAVATHANAFETLKAHADRLQEQLETKALESGRLREQVFALENSAAEEKEGLGSMVTSLQSELAAEKARSSALLHQANGGQRAVEAAKKELEEYRVKATRTLQSKDRLIAELQEGSSTPSSASTLELEDVKNERDLLREEVESLQNELEACRAELADAEAQAALDRDNFDGRYAASEKDRLEMKAQLESTTHDLVVSKQELSCVHDQLHRTKITLQEETLKRSEENENLQRQLQEKMSSSASNPDLEARLHALAENLIEKQTTIETLSTEKTSLKMQLERMSTAVANKTGVGVGRRSPSSVSIAVDDDRVGFSSNSDANARMRLPLLFRETPGDTGVTRGVKRAATSLDALGIKIGVFFRRYPIARVFALVYAIVLHLWVFVVLLTYTPEMH